MDGRRVALAGRESRGGWRWCTGGLLERRGGKARCCCVTCGWSRTDRGGRGTSAYAAAVHSGKCSGTLDLSDGGLGLAGSAGSPRAQMWPCSVATTVVRAPRGKHVAPLRTPWPDGSSSGRASARGGVVRAAGHSRDGSGIAACSSGSHRPCATAGDPATGPVGRAGHQDCSNRPRRRLR